MLLASLSYRPFVMHGCEGQRGSEDQFGRLSASKWVSYSLLTVCLHTISKLHHYSMHPVRDLDSKAWKPAT